MEKKYRVNARIKAIYIGIIILFISVFIIMNYAFRHSRNLLIAQETDIISQYMNRNKQALVEVTDSIRKISAASSTNKQVAAYLNQSYAGNTYSSGNINRIRSVVETLTFYRNIFFDYRMHYIILGVDGTVYSVVDGIDNSTYFGQQFCAGAQDQDWYGDFLAGEQVSGWVTPCIYDNKGQFQETVVSGKNENFILFIRRIRDYNTQKYLGLSFVSFPTENLYQILIPYQGASMALFNEEGQLVYNHEEHSIFTDLMQGSRLTGLDQKDGYFYHDMDGIAYLVHYAHIAGPDWKLINAVPLTGITGAVDELYNMISFMMIIIALGASIICFLMYVYVNAPLNRLIHKISGVHIGGTRISDVQDNAGAMLPVFGIREAEKEIGEMVDYIEKLSAQAIKQKEIEENLRFEMLRAQLKPHFLFNTLNTIKWSALVSGAGNIADMITSLGVLLESSMGRQGSEVSLREEIKVVKAWIEIRNWSIKNRIRIHTDIPEALLDVRVIKFCLQPLVENSVLHGMEHMEQDSGGGQGEIWIRAEQQENAVCITIRDNGVGISPDRLESIMQELESGQHRRVTGIGLASIHELMKIKYGEEYGLFIQSEPGKGTKVVVLFPGNGGAGRC